MGVLGEHMNGACTDEVGNRMKYSEYASYMAYVYVRKILKLRIYYKQMYLDYLINTLRYLITYYCLLGSLTLCSFQNSVT